MMKELHRTTSGIDEKLQKGRDGFSIFAGMPAAGTSSFNFLLSLSSFYLLLYLIFCCILIFSLR